MSNNYNISLGQMKAALCCVYEKLNALLSDVQNLKAKNTPVSELVKIDGATYLKNTYPNGDITYTPVFTSQP